MTMPAQFPALQQRGLAKFIKLALDFSANETLDPRITFSRTSNATRVNAQGLIEYAPHNLFDNSENLLSWLPGSGASITANATISPDGASTADLITGVSSLGWLVANSIARQPAGTLIPSTTYYGSIYVKAGTATTVTLQLRDQSTGATQQTTVTLTGSWQRISANITLGSATTAIGFILGNANGTFYAWGTQLNIGSLQPYYTTSVKNLLGYSQNFENAAWNKSNSSVLTNLLTYSQEFDNVVWAKTNATVTGNAVISPDGTTTGGTVLAVATGGDTGVRYATTQVGGTLYTASIYAKYTNTRYLVIRNLAIGATLGDQWTFFDLLNGTVGTKPASVTAVITPVGGGWYRCSVSATTLATIINNFLDYRLSTTDNAYSVLNTSTINIWGAQLVQGTNPEEYTVTTSAPAPIQVMGPLGFLGAEKLVENTVNGLHNISQGVPTIGLPMTYSFYAKAGERSKINLGGGGYLGQGFNNVFNLATGTLDTNIGNKASITSIGGGWYRCAISFIPSGSAAFNLSILDNSGNSTYTGDGTSGIYIFGAQLSDSASLDPYVYNFGAAPTSSAYYGPRFDYDPVTLAPKGLLIEESRTNLITYSQNISTTNGYQIDATSNLIVNSVVAPDGTLTASKFEAKAGGSTDQYYYRTASGLTVGATYTYSTYLKLGLGGTGRIRLSLFSLNCIFDLNTGTIITGSGTIISVGNGWYRCSVSSTATLTSDNYATADLGTFNAGQGHIVWGTQLEAGAFPTSYIPTTTASVTRTADNASMEGTNFSSWYNQSEGTFFAESDTFYTGSGYVSSIARISDNTDGNNHNISINGNKFQARTFTNFSLDVDLNSSFVYSINTFYKTSYTYKINDFAAYLPNVLLTDTAGNVPLNLNRLDIGRVYWGGVYLNGHLKSFKFFSKRFINTYLQSLTQ